MKILLEYNNSIYPVRQIVEGTIKFIDKKIASIAILLFSCLAASAYFIYRHYNLNILNKLAKGSFSYEETLRLAKQCGTSVRELTLRTNQDISNDLDALFKSCPNIEELQLVNCIISENGMKLLPPNLKSLLMADVNLSDETLMKVPQNLEQLTISYLNQPPSLTNKSFQNLPNGLKELTLRILKVSHKLTNELLANLPPNLKILFIKLDNITEEALKNKLPDLEHLIFLCPNACITDLRSLPRTLKTLDISSCQVPNQNMPGQPNYLRNLKVPGFDYTYNWS